MKKTDDQDIRVAHKTLLQSLFLGTDVRCQVLFLKMYVGYNNKLIDADATNQLLYSHL